MGRQPPGALLSSVQLPGPAFGKGCTQSWGDPAPAPQQQTALVLEPMEATQPSCAPSPSAHPVVAPAGAPGEGRPDGGRLVPLPPRVWPDGLGGGAALETGAEAQMRAGWMRLCRCPLPTFPCPHPTADPPSLLGDPSPGLPPPRRHSLLVGRAGTTWVVQLSPTGQS